MNQHSYLEHLQKISDLIKKTAKIDQKNSIWSEAISEIIDEIQKLYLLHSQEPHAIKLKKLIPRIHHRLSPQQLLHFVVPFEREIENLSSDGSPIPLQSDKSTHDRQIFPFIVVLDHLRSAENVGSILRSAECFGAVKVIFTGYTPTIENQAVCKAAMGTEKIIEWQQNVDLKEVIAELKKDNYHIVGIEISKHAELIHQPIKKQKTAFIFGNERFGLTQTTLADCDEIRKINLFGAKNSLNVSVCAGIVFYEWTKQWQN